MAIKQADELAAASRAERLRASPRMFDSNLLDKLSRVHPSVPPILFVPTIAILLVEGFVHGVGWTAPAWIVGGYLFWTLTEYWLHRVVFHFEPEKGIGAALFVWAFYAVLGSPAFLPFAAGFLAGYLAYDMLHYHVHHHTPTTRLGKRLRELHMRHHFQDHERGFGVSAPFWDHLFGTAPKARPKRG